ncbi:putative short chain dehydrogenase reductase family protein [Rosellinia necatrix]|uniref:Putative short chain dehydrogenase reductase family protein n=1 Tax=Rosellinia necatrix TaxID=77044 RepID=A0A1W2TWU4_ROSNE|nr:putative short chain dehydrogenase reductase family protein [Rosellinia necatrix]
MDLSTLFRVDGMVAVITGGGTGIGLAFAKALAAAGARKVYILGRRASVLSAAAAAAAHTDVLVPVVCDVTSKASLQAAVDTIAAASGHVNLLVANAGISGPMASYGDDDDEVKGKGEGIAGLRRRLFEDVDEAAFTHTLRVNASAAFLTIGAFLALLDAGNRNAVGRRGGYGAAPDTTSSSGSGGGSASGRFPHVQSQVVVTASIAAYSRESASPPAYVASKAAVVQLAQQAATNLAPYQIRVNTLAPGWFMSEMAEPILNARDSEAEGPGHPDFVPARRWGTEEELAGTILYLASRAGAYCNGTIFTFDGGRLAVMPSTY